MRKRLGSGAKFFRIFYAHKSVQREGGAIHDIRHTGFAAFPLAPAYRAEGYHHRRQRVFRQSSRAVFDCDDGLVLQNARIMALSERDRQIWNAEVEAQGGNRESHGHGGGPAIGLPCR